MEKSSVQTGQQIGDALIGPVKKHQVSISLCSDTLVVSQVGDSSTTFSPDIRSFFPPKQHYKLHSNNVNDVRFFWPITGPYITWTCMSPWAGQLEYMFEQIVLITIYEMIHLKRLSPLRWIISFSRGFDIKRTTQYEQSHTAYTGSELPPQSH